MSKRHCLVSTRASSKQSVSCVGREQPVGHSNQQQRCVTAVLMSVQSNMPQGVPALAKCVAALRSTNLRVPAAGLQMMRPSASVLVRQPMKDATACRAAVLPPAQPPQSCSCAASSGVTGQQPIKAATACTTAILLPAGTTAVVMFSMLGEQRPRKLQQQHHSWSCIHRLRTLPPGCCSQEKRCTAQSMHVLPACLDCLDWRGHQR